MMCTANNPSADDFWRGVGGGITTTIALLTAGKVFKNV